MDDVAMGRHCEAPVNARAALPSRSTLPDANVADTVGVDVEAARLSIVPAQLEAHGLPPVSPRRPALDLA